MKCDICGKVEDVELHSLFDADAKKVALCQQCGDVLNMAFNRIKQTMADDGCDEMKKTEIAAEMASVFSDYQTSAAINTIIASICRAIRGGFADGKNLFGYFTHAVKEHRIKEYGYEDLWKKK